MDDRLVSALRVHLGCVLNTFSDRYYIDLVLIPLRWLKVIVGMDWLGTSEAMIYCELQLLRVRTTSGGELVIHSEVTQ